MKISGSIPVSGVSGAYRDTMRATATQQKGTFGTDKLELSDSAKSFALALKAAKDVPDVRLNIVADIKKNIEAGTYKADSRQIADSMIKKLNLI